ncbi:MAG: hypothetical protein RLY86_4258, partial [Pseudomonadota bacterium]
MTTPRPVPARQHVPPAPEPRGISATAHLLEELQLQGYRPFQDEPDPRPLPDPDQARAEIAAGLETLAGLLTDTRLEEDLAELLWGQVNVYHRRIAVLDRELDSNEQAQRTSVREQDGSEVRSVELERLTAEGLSLVERRNAMEFFRDAAAEMYQAITGSLWRPRQGSMVNRTILTAAMIDSRDHLAARKRLDAAALLPAGPKVAPGILNGPAGSSAWTSTPSGPPSTGCAAAIPTWCWCTAERPRGPSISPPSGPGSAVSPRSPTAPTGPATARRLPSSATTRSSPHCPSASSPFQAPASPPTSATRPASPASPSGTAKAGGDPLSCYGCRFLPASAGRAGVVGIGIQTDNPEHTGIPVRRCRRRRFSGKPFDQPAEVHAAGMVSGSPRTFL